MTHLSNCDELARTIPDESDSEVDRILAGSRQDVDFTDLLWSFLHKVESYEELCHYLKVVLSIIKEEEIRPYVSTIVLPILGVIVVCNIVCFVSVVLQ